MKRGGDGWQRSLSPPNAPQLAGGFFTQIKDVPGCYSQGTYENQYSGKFNVRIPRSLHRKLDEMAEKEGVSLNHYLVSTLSRAVGQKESQPSRARKSRSSKPSTN